MKDHPVSPVDLICWCRERDKHVETAQWLCGLYCVATLSKPDIESLMAFVRDLNEHAPKMLEPVVVMIDSLRGVLTQIEYDALKALLHYLSLPAETRSRQSDEWQVAAAVNQYLILDEKDRHRGPN